MKELKIIAQQILGVPHTALLTNSNCKTCGGLKHAYWFGHPEMKALAQAYLDLKEATEGAYELLKDIEIGNSGHPEQDAFEREIFEKVKVAGNV